MIRILILVPFLFPFLGCRGLQKIKMDEQLRVLPVSDVNWEQLNPARGDKSPKAATLWGDRKRNVPTGFLVKFVDGFSSPPHIHNVTYKGVVISGLIHNDDPSAANMWMPSGSYWTQPAGELHITSAKGKNNVAFIEINSGPYLVYPKEKAFDSGERPINVHVSNIIWYKSGNSKLAHLWKNSSGRISGSLVKFNGKVSIKSKSAHIVIIQGTTNANFGDGSDFKVLEPGSYFTINHLLKDKISCQAKKNDCVLYIKSDSGFSVL